MVNQVIDRRTIAIPGPQGPQGERGERGLPGPNSVPTDEAVAALIGTEQSDIRSQLDTRYRTVFSVREYGAVGDGVTDDTAAIQAALDRRGTIFFPQGIYRVMSRLRLYSDTDIWLDDAATIMHNGDSYVLFLNGDYEDSSYATGYAGDGNIRFRGGTIDCSPRAAVGATIALNFAHADGIRIEGVSFRGGAGNSHYVEINSSRHVVIRDCKFTGWDSQGYENREAINIDHATQTGFPAFGAWDGTTCDNVLIESNVFTDVQVAVGNHSGDLSSERHTNIRVLNNSMRNLGQYGVRALGWADGSSIVGNSIVGCEENAIRCEKAENVIVLNNTLDGVALGGSGGAPAIWMSQATRCRVLNNRVSNAGWGVDYSFAVSLDSNSDWCEIETRGMDAGASGVVNDGNVARIVIDSTTTGIVDDDSVLRVPFPGSDRQGLVIISMNSAAGYAPRGMYWGRASGSLSLTKVVDMATSGLTVTTGDLSGTTGTDGGITLSVFDGDLLVENRAGFDRKVNIQFVSG